MHDIAGIIAANVEAVNERIADAATRSGRDAGDVTLVAVTKSVGVREIEALAAAGCRHLGESRPQALWEKAGALADANVDWHMIGHLQRNKVARTLPLVSLVHSVDSLRLLAEIDRSAAASGRVARVLLEVNVSGDAAKHGFAPERLEEVFRSLSTTEHVDVRGLMAMAGAPGDQDAARSDFARLRRLRDELISHARPFTDLDELSMGMSGDFEQAIAEGATIVRIGSALFEGIA
jgi:hypothetical protein